MRRPFPVLLGLSAVVFLAPSAPAQEPEEIFYEAYYLEHEPGELELAFDLYDKVAKNRRAKADLRSRAESRARGIAEDLATRDLARLVPADTIFFAELSEPGEQLSMLLDQLGLLGEAHEVSADRFGVSPLLIDYFLGLQGVAVAVTEMGPDGEPNGVLLVHPGRHDGLRGLIDTVLPAAGQPAPAIGGFPTWKIEDEALVCLTSRLVVAGRDASEIGEVVERLSGKRKGSLADNPTFVKALRPNERGLLSFFVNAEPLKPMIRGMAQQHASEDPGAAFALGTLDLESLQSLSGRIGIESEGLSMDLALDLAEGHRNLVFDLLRRPTVGAETLELVPEGAAFFLATAFNPEGAVAPIARDGRERPVVSLLDFGREMFGNVVDVALFGMPPTSGAQGLPDVSLVVRVNDVERSQALWELLLGTASGATGAEPGQEKIAGKLVRRFPIQQVPVYLATEGQQLVISPSREAIERALTAKHGQSVREDPVFAKSLELLGSAPTLLIAACPGRCIEMARPFQSHGEATELAPFAHMLEGTTVSISTQHSDTRMAFSTRLTNIPDVSGLVAQAIAQNKRGAQASELQVVHSSTWAEAPATEQAVAELDLELLRERFDELAHSGDSQGARQAASKVAAVARDAKWLNNFAWALLTEEPYGQRFDDVANVLSLRSNELSEYSNCLFLDTLALAQFRAGNAARALELQTKAVELADGAPQKEDLKQALERYRKAVEGQITIVKDTPVTDAK